MQDSLRKFDVNATELTLQHRQWKYDQEYDPTENETILVLAVKEVADKNWESACREIRSACLDAGLGSMNVEIADERGLQPTLSHPISAHEPFAVQWYRIRPRVIALLPPQKWLSISLLRRGTSADYRECSVTIVITIPENSESHRSGARDNIAAMLESEYWYEVAVEIGRGRIWQGAVADGNRQLLDPERDWKIPAQMGRSLGRRDTLKKSGTLGGFIEILPLDTDEWKRYGLTCFHCVLPPTEIPTSHVENLKKHGIRDGAYDIEMDQPSSGDHHETLRYFQDRINDLRSKRHELIARRLKDPHDCVIPSDKRKFKQDQSIIESFEEKIKSGEGFFRENHQHLGTVFAGSGLGRTENGFTLDWALIEIKQERVSQNKVSIYLRISKQATVLIHGKLLSVEEVRNVVDSKNVNIKRVVQSKLYNPVENKVVGAQVLVTSDDDLFKFGRTTDFTWGRQNGVHECRLVGWREDDGGVLRQETHDDYQVVGMPPSDGLLLGDGGDSGSFVLNCDGAFVGLYFGGNTHTNTGYYTAAYDLFASIKSVTGARGVRLPDLELNEDDDFPTV